MKAPSSSLGQALVAGLRLAFASAPIVCVLLFPLTALASTVRVVKTVWGPGTDSPGKTFAALEYRAGPGERNHVTIVRVVLRATVTDLAGITPGQGCVRAHPRATTVHCSLAADQVQRAVLVLGDRGDYVRLVGGLSGVFEGGSGDDVLIAGGGRHWVNDFRGGPGNDRMMGGPGYDDFDEDSRRNGADTINGGAEEDSGLFSYPADTVSYSDRRNGVTADLNGRRDDGEHGERDSIVGVADLFGGRGRDRLAGDSGKNRLEGRAGADTILGRGGDDSLDGGDGSDFLSGGPGWDGVSAGAGDDTVRMRDGSPDSAGCGDDEGGGFDRLYLDGFDRFFSGIECEQVSRSGVAGLVLVGGPTFLMYARDQVRFEVACPPDAPPQCVGTVTFTRGARVLGSTTISLLNGHSDDPDSHVVRLPRDVAAAVRARGKLGATAAVSFRDPAGHEIVRQTPITVAPAQA